MHKKLLIALLATALPLPALAADTYTIDPYHAGVFLKTRHLGFSTVYIRADDVKGTLVLDEAAPEKSKVDITIATKSINGFIPNFNAHLHSRDFFEVETYPAVTFTSTKVEPTGDKTAKVYGDLTIKDTTKPVVLDVTLNNIGKSPFSEEEYRAGFSGRTVLKRSDFGMDYALPHVGDEVEVVLEIEWLRQ